MKLYGSINNRIEECRKQPEPVVGMGVTEYLYSDKEPYEIVEVKSSKRIVVRRLEWKRIDNNGMSESQDYELYSDTKNATKTLFKNKRGQWKEVGYAGGSTFGLGKADKYEDPTF